MPGVTVPFEGHYFIFNFSCSHKERSNQQKKFQREKFYNSIWFKAKFKANNRSQTTYSSLAPGKTVTALFITRREKKRDLELGCVVWTIWNSVGVLKKWTNLCRRNQIFEGGRKMHLLYSK